MQSLNQQHALTQNKDYELLVELSKGASTTWALYQKFAVGSESEQYALIVSGYDPTSTAGDGLSHLAGMKWSSPDRDNDAMGVENCAKSLASSFWFNSCSGTNPLGSQSASGDKALIWESSQEKLALDSITFKVRERLCEEGSGLHCDRCKVGAYLCTSEAGIQTCCTQMMESCERAVKSGVHELVVANSIVKVYCDSETDGGGWVQLLARRDGAINDFFSVDYEDYARRGHGIVGGDNILPLDTWNSLTQTQSQELLVEMQFQNTDYYVRYFTFKVGDSTQHYQMTLGSHDPQSTAGTSLDSANGMKFSSVDVDNDLSENNCAETFKRPFWNAKCGLVGPLSIFGDKNLGRGIYWQSITGCCNSLQNIFFKTRPKQCAHATGSSCTACNSGYELIHDSKSGRKICSPVCNAAACTQCHSSNPRICIGQCRYGYFFNQAKEICERCSGQCSTCSSESYCDTCVGGLLAFEGKCISECPSTYFSNPLGQCNKCPFQSCSKCTQSECQECSHGYYLLDGKCVSSCPAKAYLDASSNKCTSCATECDQCSGPTSSNCKSCNAALNYELQAPSSCVCPARHFPAADKSCTECNSRCLTCQGPSQGDCVECIPDYWKKDGKCYRCEDTPGLVTESYGVCQEVCGDGIDLGMNECEDANTDDGDGCSAACKLEPNYTCKSQSINGPFSCWKTIAPFVKSAEFASNWDIRIQFSEPVEIRALLSTSDFDLKMIDTSEPVLFSVTSPPTLKLFSNFTIRLNEIQKEDEDRDLLITFLDPSKFKNSNKLPLQPTELTITLKSEARRAHQATVDRLYNLFSPETLFGSVVVLTAFIFFSTFGGGILWSLIFNLQMFSFLPLINVRLPPIILRLFTVFSFLNLEFKAAQDSIYEHLGIEMEPRPFTPRFEEYRFRSSKFFQTVPFFLALVILLLLILPIIIVLNKGLGSTCYGRCTSKILQAYRYSIFLKLSLSLYMQILLSSLLSSYKIDFSTALESCSTLTGFFFLFIFSSLPVIVAFIMSRSPYTLESQQFRLKYRFLVQDLKIPHSSGIHHYYTIFLFRRLGFIMLIFFFYNLPGLIITLCILMSLGVMTYLFLWKPFVQSHKHFLEVVNESCYIIVCLLFLLLQMNDSVFDNHGYTIGWICLVIALFCVFIHFFVLIPENLRKCCSKEDKEPKVINTAKRVSLKDEPSPRHNPQHKGLESFRGAQFEIMVSPESTPRQPDSFRTPRSKGSFRMEDDDCLSSDRAMVLKSLRQSARRPSLSTNCVTSFRSHKKAAPSLSFFMDPKEYSIQEYDSPGGWRSRISSDSETIAQNQLSFRSIKPVGFEEGLSSLEVPAMQPIARHSSSAVTQRAPKLKSQSFYDPGGQNEMDLLGDPFMSTHDKAKGRNGELGSLASFGDARQISKLSSFSKVKMAFG